MHALYNPHRHGSGEPGERVRPDADTMRQLRHHTQLVGVSGGAHFRPRYAPTTHALIARYRARLRPCSPTRPPTRSPPAWADTATVLSGIPPSQPTPRAVAAHLSPRAVGHRLQRHCLCTKALAHLESRPSKRCPGNAIRALTPPFAQQRPALCA
eukprot:86286-Pleurochrysis_carterae.AAC.1